MEERGSSAYGGFWAAEAEKAGRATETTGT